MKCCPDCKSKKKHKCLCHQVQELIERNGSKGKFLVFDPDDFDIILKHAKRNGFSFIDKAIDNGTVL